MPLGLGASLSKASIVTPGVVTDGLIMKHMYPAGAVQKLSDGAAYFVQGSSNDYIEIADSADLSPSSLTVSAWVHFGGSAPTDNFPRIIDTDGDALGWHLRYNKANTNFTLKVSSDGSNDEVSSTDSTYTDYNKWYHVSATYDSSSGTIKMYVDGVHDGTDTGEITGAINNPSGPIRIGKSNIGDGQDWSGYMCNIGVWGRVLTQAEIKSIMFKQYADLSTTEKASLVSFWNLDSTVADDIPLIYDENNTTLGANLWDGGDVGPDSLGDADGNPSHSMDISNVGLAAGDVIKLSATISGSNGGRIICPDVAAGSNGVTRIPADATNSHTTDGDIVRYLYVSDVTGVLKIRTDFDGSGDNQDDRTQKITNISIQKITSAGRLV